MKRLILLTTAVAALTLLAFTGSAAARSHDRNHDGIRDSWERHFHLSVNVNQARRDQDHDGLNNKREFKQHTNPRDADTDNDGLDDGDEVRTANDARDNDTDDNGVEDGEENAGRIASFDPATGTLVIDLGDNKTATGQVTSATRIECRTAEEQEAENEAGDDNVRSADHGSDDSSGPGSGGDDRSGSSTSGSGTSGSDNSGPGSTSSGPGPTGDDRNDNERTCGTADLTAGTVVHEAELELENGQATFEKVELIKQ